MTIGAYIFAKFNPTKISLYKMYYKNFEAKYCRSSRVNITTSTTISVVTFFVFHYFNSKDFTTTVFANARLKLGFKIKV